jgi:alpha-tubulin suppressor-like RCC1 family protein
MAEQQWTLHKIMKTRTSNCSCCVVDQYDRGIINIDVIAKTRVGIGHLPGGTPRIGWALKRLHFSLLQSTVTWILLIHLNYLLLRVRAASHQIILSTIMEYKQENMFSFRSNRVAFITPEGQLAQCGDPASSPELPSTDEGIVAVRCGLAHTIVLKSTGSIVVAGENNHGQCNVPPGLGAVVAISAGKNHCAVLTHEGKVVCWGTHVDNACKVPDWLGTAIAVSCGYSHTAAVTEDGTVVCWGYNDRGRCEVPATLQNVTAVSCGSIHTIALTREGRVVCWGNNEYGQLDVPSDLDNVIAISCGSCHSAALTRDGKVICWGHNRANQCSVPADLEGVAAIGCTDNYTAAVRYDGGIIRWGHTTKFDIPLDAIVLICGNILM